MGKSKQKPEKNDKSKDRQVKEALKREKRQKGYGRRNDEEFKQLNKLLGEMGLQIRDVAGDGNCLFRAVADQMDGDERRHLEYRDRTCDFIQSNADSFAPFVEDDEPFPDYVARMRRDGQWAGNLELQAVSVVCQVNIFIYQLNGPRLDIVNFPGNKTIHISYHQGEHYASVQPLSPEVAKALASQAAAEKAGGGSTRREDEPTKDEMIIMQSTGCSDLTRIRALLSSHWDVDSVINLLVEEQNQVSLEDEEMQRAIEFSAALAAADGFEVPESHEHEEAVIIPPEEPQKQKEAPKKKEKEKRAPKMSKYEKKQAKRKEKECDKKEEEKKTTDEVKAVAAMSSLRI